MEKKCFKCGDVKDICEFYAHKMMADGHLGKCKECAKADVRKNRDGKVSRYRAYDRMRYFRDGAEHRGSSRWAQANPDESRRSAETWAERNPLKRSAQQAVSNAVRDGRLVRGPCSICGETERVHGHHHDYDRPLDVIWLCTKHHAHVHFLLREVERPDEERTPMPCETK